MPDEVKTLSKDTFIDTLSTLIGIAKDDKDYEGILQELWNAYDTRYKNEPIGIDLIPDLVISAKDSTGKPLTPLFDAKFNAFIKIKNDPQNATGITSIKDYVMAKASYKELFAMYNLKELATDENINKFLEGNVSAAEAQARMANAYNAINNADSILKSQLGSLGIKDKDLAKALLTGKEGALELENKIKVANIKAAEVESGIKSMIGAEELAKQGIGRDVARQGLAQVKSILPGTEAAAQRAGIETQGLQKELESESVLGMASQRRKKAQTAEQARFSGRSGTANISLGKTSAGSF